MPMFSVDEIKELLKAFDDSKATELEIKAADGEKLLIRRNHGKGFCPPPPPHPRHDCDGFQNHGFFHEPLYGEAPLPAPGQQTAVSQNTGETEEGKIITSPMVGVFYAAPSPNDDPYVSVGSNVKQGDVLCLIEAMKLMNEVQAEQNGEIVKICAENGQVVEYGQPLFVIK